MNLKIKVINFCCFHMGKVVIMCIRRPSQIDDMVYPGLKELELYVRTSTFKQPVERLCKYMNDVWELSLFQIRQRNSIERRKVALFSD